MPPHRSINIPPKPVKTERTHEENQERYVLLLAMAVLALGRDFC
jgi:hypothetical protein